MERHRVLAVREIDDFLCYLANAEVEAIARRKQRFSALMPELVIGGTVNFKERPDKHKWSQLNKQQSEQDKEQRGYLDAIDKLQGRLKKAWTAKDYAAFDWWATWMKFDAIQAARQSRDVNNRKHPVSRVSTPGSPKGTIVLNTEEQWFEDKLDNEQPFAFPFLDALHRLSDLASAQRLSVCGNERCPAPYFIAKRKSQRFCTEACAGPANRESKRKWWQEHGRSWREAQTHPNRERGQESEAKGPNSGKKGQ